MSEIHIKGNHMTGPTKEKIKAVVRHRKVRKRNKAEL